MSTQTGSISFESTGNFSQVVKQNYATLSQIKGQFAVCSTGASTAEKIATTVPTNADWTLYAGATVTVKFTSANTASVPTLNVNNTGPKEIRDYNANELLKAAREWPAGAAIAFTYDGTYWRIQDSNLMERVHSAETRVDQTATSITSLASMEDNYIKPDGTTATNNLKSYVDQTAEGITTTIENITETVQHSGNLLPHTSVTIADREWLSTNIRSAWTDIPIVSAGGYDAYKYDSSWAPAAYWSGYWYKLRANTYYTYSVDVYYTKTVSFNMQSLGHFQVWNANSDKNDKSHEDVAEERIFLPSTVPANTWTRVSVTFLTNSLDDSSFAVYPRFNIAAGDGTLYFKNAQLEYGKIATGWSPSSFDLSTVTNTVNSVKQTADANTLSISGLTTTTQLLRDDLDNLEIGGRNLFKDSETISTSSWTYENASNSNGVAEVLTTGSGNHRIYQMPANGYWSWESDTEYVASIEAKCSGDNGKLQMNPVGAAVTWKEFPLTTEWKRYAYTFTSGNNVTTGSMSFYNTGASDTIVYLRKPKLEKGNKATDWSPAPEDVQGSITTLESRSSKIEQTLDGFSSTVGAIVDETVTGTNILTGNALNPYNWTISAPASASYTKTAYGTAGVKVQFSTISGYERLYSPAITVVSGKKYTLSVEYTVGKDYVITSGRGGFGLSVYKAAPTDTFDSSNANFVARAQFLETATRVAMKATITFTAPFNTIYLGLNGAQINDGQSGLSFTLDKLTLVENISSRMSSAETTISQTANNVLIKATESDTTAAQGGQHLIQSLINVAPSGVTISADKVNIEGATIFTSGRLSESTLDGKYVAETNITSATDFNTLVDSGVYYIKNGSCTNAPVTNWGKLDVSVSGKVVQWFYPDALPYSYYRAKTSNTWSAWSKVDGVGAANAVQSNLDNLEIGGRNLVQQSTFGRSAGGKVYPPNTDGSLTIDGYKFIVTANPGDSIGGVATNIAGDTVVVSMRTTYSGTGRRIYRTWYDDNDNQVGSYTSETVSLEDGRITAVLTVPTGATKLSFGLCYPYNEPYTAWDLKVECGNKATDWTPAPEDQTAYVDGLVDSIAIGGTNLLRGTADFSGATGKHANTVLTPNGYMGLTVASLAKTDTSTYADIVAWHGRVTPQPSTWYTLSFWAKASSNLDASSFFYASTVEEGYNSSGQTTNLVDGSIVTNITTKWERHWITWKTLSTLDGVTAKNVLPIRLQAATTGTVYIAGVMFEQGNKASSWSPAPEDQTAYVDNMQVGGTNLLAGTAEMKAGTTGTYATGMFRASGGSTLSNVTTSGLPVPLVSGAIRATNGGSSAATVGFCQDSIAGLKVGDSLTQSGWIRASTSMQVYFQPAWISSGNTGSNANAPFSVTTEWQKFSFTGTLSGTQAAAYSLGYVYGINCPSGAWFEVCALKVEKGQKATDWSANPRDQVARTQRIYYRKNASGAPSVPTSWVTTGNNGTNYYDQWTTKVSPIKAETNRYLYLYTCEQSQRGDGSLTHTTVLLDDSTTVIDGGKIITGSVTANAIKADSGTFNTANIPNLSAAKITSGDIVADRIKTNVVNAINATVNKIDAKNINVNAINIGDLSGTVGGKNLALDSDQPYNWQKYTPTTYEIAQIKMTEDFIPGETYTVTIWGGPITRSDKSSCWYALYWGGGNFSLANTTLIETGVYRATFTISTTSTAQHTAAGNNILDIYNTPAVGASGTTYSAPITKIQIEKGNIGTEWEPAQEELPRPNLYKTTTTMAYIVGSGSSASGTITAHDDSYHGRTLTVTTAGGTLRISNIIPKTNIPYTVSFILTASVATTISVDIMDNTVKTITVPKGTSKVIFTSTPTRAVDSTYHFIDMVFNTAGTYKMENIKVEMGTVATTWIEAEQISNYIHADSTGINIYDNRLSNANKYYLRQTAGGTYIYRNTYLKAKYEDTITLYGGSSASGANPRTEFSSTALKFIDANGKNRLWIDASAADFYDTNGKLGTRVNTDGLTIYKAGSKRAQTTTNGLDIFGSDGSTSIASFGSTARVGTTATGRVEVTSTGVGLYNKNNKMKVSIGTGNSIFYGGEGTYPYIEVSTSSTGAIDIKQSANAYTSITSSGMEIFANINSTKTSVANFGTTARIGATNGAAFIIDSKKLQAYYMKDNTTRTKYFEVSPTSMTYGNYTVANTGDVTTAGNTANLFITPVNDNEIKLHSKTGKASNNYAKINSDGLWVYKQNDLVAKFSDSVTLGREGYTRVEVNFNSFKMLDRNGNKYCHISDLRNESGSVYLEEEFVVPNSGKVWPKFEYSHAFNDDVIIYLGQVSYQYSDGIITYEGTSDMVGGSSKRPIIALSTTAIPVGSTITVKYRATDDRLKGYTFGIRDETETKIGGLSFSEGYGTSAIGNYSHSEGADTRAEKEASHAEGVLTVASGNGSHAEGFRSVASGEFSHAEGGSHFESWSVASGFSSHAECVSEASGNYSHAENYSTASGECSHAENDGTASGEHSHAENKGKATGNYSHAEGSGKASGNYSHAENSGTAIGESSHASGKGTIANYSGQFVCGIYNSNQSNSLFEVGNGTSSTRSNALTLDTSGNLTVSGTIKQNSTAVSLSGHKHAASDVNSGTFDAARIPNLAASKITSGTLPVARGGTGKTAGTCYMATPLYENTSGKFSGAITLSETAANFTFIEIYCKDNDGRYCYTKVWSPNGKTVNVTQTLSYGGNFYVKSKAYTISGTGMDTANTSGTYHTGEVNAAGNNSGSTVDNLGVVKVIGYK